MKKNHIIKKIIGFLVAIIATIILSPFFIVIAVLIKLDSRGPVFFRQERLGKNGKKFRIWKFRTMVNGAEKITQGRVVAKGDGNITKIGEFLRDWTLDEWPQLINVIKGEMSLVGPRPLPEYQNQEEKGVYEKRFQVLPGMVSLVDTKGRNLVPWQERFKIDNWYVDNWSLWLDLKIILLTPFVIISRKGVYGEGGKNTPPESK